MRVLVTGHNGYIGSVLVPVVQAAGHDVVGLDAFLFETCGFGHDGSRVPALRMDLRDVRPHHLRDSMPSSTSPRCATIRWAI